MKVLIKRDNHTIKFFIGEPLSAANKYAKKHLSSKKMIPIVTKPITRAPATCTEVKLSSGSTKKPPTVP